MVFFWSKSFLNDSYTESKSVVKFQYHSLKFFVISLEAKINFFYWFHKTSFIFIIICVKFQFMAFSYRRRMEQATEHSDPEQR